MESVGKKLTKGMAYVFVANMLNMVFNLTTNFILPKYLSINSYAAIKTFQLYTNYVGVFHLGFVDGLYLKYGGKEFNEISNQELNLSLSTVRIFQGTITLLVLGGALLSGDNILLVFALAILPLNIVSYFRMLYQAIGEFRLYSKITYITTGLTFLVNIILLLIVKTDNYIIYLLNYVIVDIVIWVALEHFFKVTLGIRLQFFSFSIKEFLENIKSGFALMCGNFTSFLLTGLDRWFVKFTLNTYAFAQYSFAVSIENMLNLAITPVTVPLYNYFCKENTKDKLKTAHKAIILFSISLIASAFIAEFAIELILDNYLSATKVIFLLFAAQAFQIVIKAIYVNLYKVRRQQKRYFIKLLAVTISGIIFNILCFSIVGVKEAYAWGTFLSGLLWFLISIPDFKELYDGFNDIIFLFLEVILFLICGFTFEAIIGLLIYGIGSCILCFVFMRKFLIKIANIGRKSLQCKMRF